MADHDLPALLERWCGDGNLTVHALLHYLRADLGVLREEGLGDPRNQRWYTRSPLILERIAYFFPAERVAATAAVMHVFPDRTAPQHRIVSTLGDVLARLGPHHGHGRPVLVPALWYYEFDRPQRTVTGHAALLVVHPGLRQIVPWDANGYATDDRQGYTHPERLREYLVGAGWSYAVVPMPRAHGSLAGTVQSLLEPSPPLRPSPTVPEEGLCLYVSALVLLCALRFDCPNLWHVADRLVDILGALGHRSRLRVAQNLVVTLQRVHRAHRMTEVAALLGLWRPTSRVPRPCPTRCGLLAGASGGGGDGCPRASSDHSPWCSDHLREVFGRQRGRGWPAPHRSPRAPWVDADAFDGCMHGGGGGARPCGVPALPGSRLCRRHGSRLGGRPAAAHAGPDDDDDDDDGGPAPPPTKRAQVSTWPAPWAWMEPWRLPTPLDGGGVFLDGLAVPRCMHAVFDRDRDDLVYPCRTVPPHRQRYCAEHAAAVTVTLETEGKDGH